MMEGARALRRYEYVAQKEHWCSNCCQYILPGQYYEGIVYATNNHGIVVHKRHLYPGCEPPPDPDEEERIFDSGEERIFDSGLEETSKIAA
jgi:hypothetical protein